MRKGARINKIIIILCIFLSIFIMVFSLPKTVKASEINLLSDSEFDNEPSLYDGSSKLSLNAWTKYMNAYRITNNALNGSGAIELDYDSSDGSISKGLYPSIWQDVNLKAYTYYTFSIYVKRTGEASNGDICIGYRNPLAANHFISLGYNAYNDTTTDYSKISITFCTDELTTLRLAVHIETKSTGNNGAYILDTASLKEEKNISVDSTKLNGVFSNKQNILNDPGFENNTTSGATNIRNIYKKWTSTGWCGIDKLNYGYNSYSNAYLIYSNSNLLSGEIASCFEDVDVEKNAYYSLSFMVRRFESVNVSPLYAGFKDPYSTDPDLYVDKVEVNGISNDYEERSILIYSGDRTTIRIDLSTESIECKNGELGGYHLDDITLCKVKNVSDVKIEYDNDSLIGERINQTYSVKFEGETEYYKISLSNYINLEFETDEEIIKSDISGNLVGLKNGTSTVKAKFTICGTTFSKENIVVIGNEKLDNCIKNVYVSLDSELSTTKYSKLNVSVEMIDGSYLLDDDYDLIIKSSDTKKIYIRKMIDGYYAIGVGNGSASIYATAIFNESYGISKLEQTVSTSNYLIDPGFESQNDTFVWKLEGTSGAATDDGKTNIYMRSGYSNLWLMSPVWWDANVKNDSYVRVSQSLHLESGKFELSVYINRFPANGTNGTLSGKGGIATLGIILLDEDGNETTTEFHQEFDTSYGSIAYEKISLVMNLEEGNYLAYLKVQGDEEFGLGMQVDDFNLSSAIYPKSISVSITDDDIYIDDIYKINVTANYEDGTKETLNGNLRYIFSDYKIACESGGFLIGREEGTTTLTIKTTILDKEYETTVEIKINSTNPVTPKKDYTVYYIIGSSLVLIGLGLGLFFIIRKRRLKTK